MRPEHQESKSGSKSAMRYSTWEIFFLPSPRWPWKSVVACVDPLGGRAAQREQQAQHLAGTIAEAPVGWSRAKLEAHTARPALGKQELAEVAERLPAAHIAAAAVAYIAAELVLHEPRALATRALER